MADPPWPMHDERGADAAFLGEMFVEAEGRVAQVGPGTAIGLVRSAAADLPQIPSDWASAIDAFETSSEVNRIFHPELIRNFVLTKRQELHYMEELTPNERVEIYLETV